MAGGKATPRQKMINMMYLVLTALLALNVSKEILLSFNTIANSLRITGQQLSTKNDQLASDVNQVLTDQEAKKKMDNLYLRPYITEVGQKADEMYSRLEFHIDRMKSDSIGQYDTLTKTLNRSDESEKNYRFWMIEGPDGAIGKETDNEGRGAGRARLLREAMNKYVDWANGFYLTVIQAGIDQKRKTDKTYKPSAEETELINKLKERADSGNPKHKYLAVDPKDDPTVPISHELKGKPWEYFTFHGAPAIANVAMLEKYKTDVRVIETELLEFVKGRIIDRPIFVVNKLMLVDAPESNVVVAGLPFQSKLFITMSSKTGDKKPAFSGTGVKPDKAGDFAMLKVNADARVVPKGKNQGEQSYSATATLTKADGTKEVLKLSGKFTVRLPTVKAGFVKKDPVYLECANDLSIDVPELGDYYKPVYEGVGGEASMSKANIRLVRAIPKTKKYSIKVYNDFNGSKVLIGEEEFRVLTPPPPTIKVFVDGKEWDPTMKFPPTAKVRVYAFADKQFAEALPKDANYTIDGIKVSVRRGIGSFAPEGAPFPKSKPDEKTFIDIPLGRMDNLKRDNQILFEIMDVSRVNYQGKSIQESMSTKDKTVLGNIG